MSRGIRIAVLVAVLGAVVLAVAIPWMSKSYAPAEAAYQVHVTLPDVGGLRRGNPVMLGDVRVGKVLRINLSDDVPVVTLGFHELGQVPKDSKFLLKAVSKISPHIELVPGSATESLANGASVHGG
jgi:ABC-type transporter Mla subunit MlaD